MTYYKPEINSARKQIIKVRLFGLQDEKCGICSLAMFHPKEFVGQQENLMAHTPSLDHLWPKSRKGKLTPDNTLLTHRLCNQLRKDAEPSPYMIAVVCRNLQRSGRMAECDCDIEAGQCCKRWRNPGFDCASNSQLTVNET